MSNQYTPGPWKVGKRRTGTSAGSLQLPVIKDILGDGDAFVLAWVVNHNASYCPSDEANAHLISASPELLEAAKAALDDFKNARRTVETLVQLRKAIEKAEGRTK